MYSVMQGPVQSVEHCLHDSLLNLSVMQVTAELPEPGRKQTSLLDPFRGHVRICDPL